MHNYELLILQPYEQAVNVKGFKDASAADAKAALKEHCAYAKVQQARPCFGQWLCFIESQCPGWAALRCPGYITKLA